MNQEHWSDVATDDEADDLASSIATRAEEIYTAQHSLFRSFYVLDATYDALGGPRMTDTNRVPYQVVQNVIASTVDTLAAAIGSTEVTPRVMTEDAPWSERRKAQKLAHYMDGLGRVCKVADVAEEAIKYGALKGTSGVKCHEWHGKLTCEYVPVNRLLVPDYETRTGYTRELLHVFWRDRRDLQAQFPGQADELEEVQSSLVSEWDEWEQTADATGTGDALRCLEAWQLPVGVKGKKGYRPGRHVLIVGDIAVVNAEFHEAEFPFAFFRWTTRPDSWYGIGAGHRIMGHQWHLNRYNRQIDRLIQQCAYPTTWAHLSDAGLQPRAMNELGTIAYYKTQPPKTVIPPAVSPETYSRGESIKRDAYDEVGVSQMAARASKPAGLDSGAALREYRDQTTQRYARQERAREHHVLDILFLCLQVARGMGDAAPHVVHVPKFGQRTIRRYKLSDVDLEILRAQLYASSPLARTPAGRIQLALEMGQAGAISTDEMRRLMAHPDIDSMWSVYTAALDDIDATIEEMLDGTARWPEPMQNLALGKWRVQQTYLRVRHEKAPDDVLENLSLWVTQAAYLLDKAAPEAPPAGPPMAAPLTEQAPLMPPGAGAPAAPPM